MAPRGLIAIALAVALLAVAAWGFDVADPAVCEWPDDPAGAVLGAALRIPTDTLRVKIRACVEAAVNLAPRRSEGAPR